MLHYKFSIFNFTPISSMYLFCCRMCVRQDIMGSDLKNCKGLLIALLVIAAICGVILLVIAIVTPGTFFCPYGAYVQCQARN